MWPARSASRSPPARARLAAVRTAGAASAAAGRRNMSGHGSPEEIFQQKGAETLPDARAACALAPVGAVGP